MNDKTVIRIKFAKDGVMKFVGHLDTMRYFQKAIRRAGLPAAYSKGFHPHMLLSFALPLGVGVTTEGDYFDLELDCDKQQINTDSMLLSLKEQMAVGTDILDIKLLEPKAKKAMAAVTAATYKVSIFNLSKDRDYQALIREFMGQNEIIIEKKTKKSVRTLDLKPLIYEMNLTEFDGFQTDIQMTVSAGSNDNIKPQLVMEHFLKSFSEEIDDYSFKIHRIDLLSVDESGKRVPLNSIG